MNDWISSLNKRQQEAVLHHGEPLLILAGAGSGKTRVITTKIAYMISQGLCDPYSILAVTFTNKAAGEMKERVVQMVPEAERVLIRTFHSFGAWLLRRHSHLLGLNENFTIYDDDDQLALIKTLIPEKLSKSELKALSNKIHRAKDRCLGPENGGDFFEDDFTADLYRRYNHKLHEIGNVDFGDLISLPVHLLRTYPEVKAKLQSRFQVILVDEFQDTNFAQFELLKELYNGKNFLCVVGDEDQSIYSFRGAEIENIVSFPEVFPHTKVITLEENYRSTPQILNLALEVVKNNEYRLGKKLYAQKESGEMVEWAQLSDQDEEAQFCATILEDRNYKDTAILYRNNFQSRAFETLFQRFGIPYKLVGSVRFYEREEIKDALAYLSLLLNPLDEIAFIRSINKPSRGIGDKTIDKILSYFQGDLIETCRTAIKEIRGKAGQGLGQFLEVIDTAQANLESHTLSEMVHHLIKQSGLEAHYEEQDKLYYTSKVMNLRELVNALSSYANGKEGLGQYMESITLNSAIDNYEEDDRVTFMTIHLTKGLEFNRVILTGLEEGLFPHGGYGSAIEAREIEEERRLFYVGATRAREKLILTSCRRRLQYGQYKESMISRFIEEIPRELLAVFGDTGPSNSLRRGDRVLHNEYGTGIIENKWYNDDDEMVIVRFDSGQMAQFLTQYTTLTRIS
ncbi:MAG: UvrD-helicase domain-containing protein [Spirochaetales bacterium]|nr:UvrD-helicase domain-containing protein [Spirochaetales bacterium]